jgi:hypothetical protein
MKWDKKQNQAGSCKQRAASNHRGTLPFSIMGTSSYLD